MESKFIWDVIGISTTQPEYVLCAQINKALGFQFKAISDIKIDTKESVLSFPLYKNNEEESVYLFGNKSEKSTLLVKKVKEADFFMAFTSENTDVKIILKQLLQIPSIQVAFPVDISLLKGLDLSFLEL